MSDSLWPCGLLPARLLRSWDFPGKNTRVGCHFLIQGIFPTQDWTHVSCFGRWILLSLHYLGSPNCSFAIEKGFKGLTLPVIAAFTAVSHAQLHLLVLSLAPEGIRVRSLWFTDCSVNQKSLLLLILSSVEVSWIIITYEKLRNTHFSRTAGVKRMCSGHCTL